MTARRATAADVETVAQTFASAFAEDPIMRWMSGVDDTEHRLQRFWRSLARSQLKKADHEVYISDDGGSVALWRGIDKWKVPPAELLPALPSTVSSLRGGVFRMLRIVAAMEKAHPTEPHYYLELLGTRRDRQGRGGGSAAMQPVLERCDAEGVPAYLESSNPRNIPFYFRHGFVEREVITGRGGWPTLTAMWREPRR